MSDGKFAAIAAALMAMSALAGCGAQEPRETAAQEEGESSLSDETRKLALPFLQRLYVDGDILGAYTRFAKPDFIQHDPALGNGLAGIEAFIASTPKANAEQRANWAHVSDLFLVDGDKFALLHRTYRSPDDPGTIAVDIWRVEDGKIAEHWDVKQTIPENMPHSNGMGCGGAKDFQSVAARQDSIAEPTCGTVDPSADREQTLQQFRQYIGDVVSGDVIAAIERWFHPDYKQHSPNIPDGKQGAIDYLNKEWGKAPPSSDAQERGSVGPQRIMAEGNIVLVQEWEEAPTNEINVDIFRFTDAKISEHWDIKQAIPDNAENENGMW